MAATHQAAQSTLRITADEVRRRMASGEPVSVLDVRSPKAYDAAESRIRGDIRVEPDDLPDNPPWPKGQLTVAYCT